MSRLVCGVLAALSLGACQGKVVEYKLAVITTACQPPSPLEGVTHLQVRVLGDGLSERLEIASAVEARQLEVPEIPAGKNRVVEVRAYAGSPGSGVLVSLGRTLPFEVPEEVPESGKPVELTVFLRRVNQWTSPSAAVSASTCAKMLSARAGHAATLLPNGKVFVSGGYELGVASEKTALSKAEVFDPATGAFTEVKDLGLTNANQQFVPLPRAFHTSTLLPSGQVLLWGGEDYRSGSIVTQLASVLIFDPEQNRYGGVPYTNHANIGRSQHSAAIDQNGKVLIAGGYTRTNNALVLADQVEWFDPATTHGFVLAGLSVARAGASMAPVQGGAFIALAGGGDSVSVKDDIFLFEFDGESFGQRRLASPLRLRTARRDAALSSFNTEESFLVLGGYGDSAATQTLASSEQVSTVEPVGVAEGPNVGARGGLCAAKLPDGRVLVVGGRAIDSVGAPARSDGSTVLLVPMPDGTATQLSKEKLKVDRYQHTCTTLADGSVLVLGGVREASGTQQVLQDAYIFTPEPYEP